MKHAGALAVAPEGGRFMQETISRLGQVDIPVCGHIGLTPQSYHRMGGHRLQGRSTSHNRAQTSADEVIEDALAVEEAGAFALVLEGIPAELAEQITERVSIPTIGIGAGSACDGQILVINDLLGLQPDFAPRFVKRYRELGSEIISAVTEYAHEVRTHVFPAAEHSVFEDTAKKVRIAKQ